MALEAMLNAPEGGDKFEVVDLARIDLTIAELAPLILALPAVSPDLIVLFAGNNWHILELSATELLLLAGALRQSGYAACRRVFLDDILAPRCRALLRLLAAVARSLNIPVIVMVPEFNLVDWRGETSELAPVLTEDRSREWLGLFDQAAAISDDEPDQLAEIAVQLIRLDGGINAASYTILGTALKQQGRLDESRRAFEAARDAPFGLLVPHSPRCPSVVQELVRSQAAVLNFKTIDLPSLFTEHLGGELPDRRLFLDYCHMTAEGIRVAMAGAARQIAQIFTGVEGATQDFEAYCPAPCPIDDGLAHFLAAFHNSQFGQRYEIIRYHCCRALELSPGVAEFMLHSLDFLLQRAPSWMCSSFDECCRSPLARRYLWVRDPRAIEKTANRKMSIAVVDVLEKKGVAADKILAAIHEKAEADCGDKINLLAARRRDQTFGERAGCSGISPTYVRAYDRVSLFYLFSQNEISVDLQLTCRLPQNASDKGTVAIKLNNACIKVLDVGSSWQSFALRAPQALQPGMNTIEIIWPVAIRLRQDALEKRARALEMGTAPEAFIVFGEIDTFMAFLRP
jgi:hypothetical protein